MENIKEILDIPSSYHIVSVPKLEISNQIKNALTTNSTSIRKLADKVGLKHPQIVRITSANNYNIDTLLKVLDGLDLEIVIKPKK